MCYQLSIFEYKNKPHQHIHANYYSCLNLLYAIDSLYLCMLKIWINIWTVYKTLYIDSCIYIYESQLQIIVAE